MKLLALAALTLGAALGLAFTSASAESIVINAVRPNVLRWAEATTITGGVGSGKADVEVYIDAQTCGEGPWEPISGAHTSEGGTFSAEFGAGINLLVRARAAGATSNVVKVQQRPSVTVQERPRGSFFVLVNAARSFWHKKVMLQRFDKAKHKWITVRSALLAETGGRTGSAFQWTKTDRVRMKVRRQSLVRATLPLSQARPCYLAGYSNLLQTR